MAHFKIVFPGVQLVVTDEPTDGSYSAAKDLTLDFDAYDTADAMTIVADIFNSWGVGRATTAALVDP